MSGWPSCPGSNRRPVRPADWSGRLRSALGRDPLAVIREPADAGPLGQEHRLDGRPEAGGRGRLVRGLALLAGGRPAAAIELLDPDAIAEAEPAFVAAIVLGRGAARLVGGDRAGTADLEGGDCPGGDRSAGAGWPASAGRSWPPQRLPPSLTRRLDDGDPWAAGLGILLRAWLRPDEPAAIDALSRAAQRFAGLGSPALAGWALALRAFVATAAGRPDAGLALAQAEAAVRRGR